MLNILLYMSGWLSSKHALLAYSDSVIPQVQWCS